MSAGGAVPVAFHIVVSHRAQRVFIEPVGELDLATSARLETAIGAASGTAPSLVVDLGGVTFMDATGLRVIVAAKQQLGARLTLLPAPPHVQRIFALTGTEAMLGFAAPAVDLRVATENVIYLRQLWEAYSRGGVRALSALLSRQHRATAAAAALPAWEAADLAAFWSRLASERVPDQTAVKWRLEKVGTNVVVACEGMAKAGRPAVIWSVYFFDGRTFIRALTFDTEAQARAHASVRHLGGAS